jgi:hypothetical protein
VGCGHTAAITIPRPALAYLNPFDLPSLEPLETLDAYRIREVDSLGSSSRPAILRSGTEDLNLDICVSPLPIYLQLDYFGCV